MSCFWWNKWQIMISSNNMHRLFYLMLNALSRILFRTQERIPSSGWACPSNKNKWIKCVDLGTIHELYMKEVEPNSFTYQLTLFIGKFSAVGGKLRYQKWIPLIKRIQLTLSEEYTYWSQIKVLAKRVQERERDRDIGSEFYFCCLSIYQSFHSRHYFVGNFSKNEYLSMIKSWFHLFCGI